MNLADAIRQAAQTNGLPIVPEPPRPAEPMQMEVAPVQPQHEEVKDAVTSPFDARSPEPPSPAVIGGNVVRLELFLSPEQMATLFRTIVATQHSVMTLRETASYLRLGTSVLEQLAQDGEIPAFLVDGKWRFPRNQIDEWLALRSSAEKLRRQEAS